MKLLLLAPLVVVVGCSPVESDNKARIDALLATGRIDHFVFVGGPYHMTNEAWDHACQSYLRILNATNRVDAPALSLSNPAADRVLLCSGTNVLGEVSYHRADEVLAFDTYCFRLKVATNYYKWFFP